MNLVGSMFNSLYFVIGILIPGYKSFKSMESDDIQSHQRWISYWIVWSLLSFISLLESLFRPSFVYRIGKAVFLGWIASDSYKGSLVLYNGLLRPILTSYSSWIDSFCSHGTVMASKTSHKLLVQMKDRAKQSTHNLRLLTANLPNMYQLRLLSMTRGKEIVESLSIPE